MKNRPLTSREGQIIDIVTFGIALITAGIAVYFLVGWHPTGFLLFCFKWGLFWCFYTLEVIIGVMFFDALFRENDTP